jgi:5-methylcytosine-specific restriction endonuclease McrA
MAGHRRPEIRFSDAPRGQCRWCSEVILYESTSKTGQVDRRRRWHPQCVDAYNESDPSEARKRIRRRDRGRCKACSLDTYALRREMRKIGRGRAREIRKRGFKPGKSFWELDHITPLIDGGGHGDENLQTLCTPCHTEKTALEARQRALLRRSAPGQQSAPSKQRASAIESEPPESSPSPRGERSERKSEQRSRIDWNELLRAADATNERVRRALDVASPN